MPDARKLHRRYSVFHDAFSFTTQQVTFDPDLESQVRNLLENMRWIWQAYSQNTVTISGRKCHINGNFRWLGQDNTMTDTAKSIVNGWIKTTGVVAGCQALRKKIGHILFAFRVC